MELRRKRARRAGRSESMRPRLAPQGDRDTMETTLLLIIQIFALILILLVYVVDRLMALEKLTRLPSFGGEAQVPAGNGDTHFGNLTGQQLWDGMNEEGWTADAFCASAPLK